MKILFMINTLGMGGAERVATILTDRWARNGHEVHLLTTYGREVSSHHHLAESVRIHRLAEQLPHPRGTAATGWRKFSATVRLIRRERFDCVCSFLVHVNVLAIMAAKACRVPVLVSERTFPPSHRIGKTLSFLRLWTYPLADYVVMQTEEGLQWLNIAIPRARGVVIRNPVEVPVPQTTSDALPDAILPVGCKLLLFVGRLSPEKRISSLIQAFARAAADKPDWHFAILGDGPEKQALQSLVDEERMGANIHLPGPVGDLDPWYRRADRFAFASLFEGFPNALAEAVCYGIPAMAIDCPTGPRDLLKHGTNGLLLPREADMDELAQGMAMLLNRDFPKAERHAWRLRRQLAPHSIARDWLDLIERSQP